jgi:hypothetical protein
MSMHAKQNGTWIKSTEPYAKTQFVWKQGCGVYAKKEGTWRHVFECDQTHYLTGNNVNLGNWLQGQNARVGIKQTVIIDTNTIIGSTVKNGPALKGGNLTQWPQVTLILRGEIQGKGGTSSNKNGSNAVEVDDTLYWVDEGGAIRAGGGAGGSGGSGGYGEGTIDNVYYPFGTTGQDSCGFQAVNYSPSSAFYDYWAASSSGQNYNARNRLGSHGGARYIISHKVSTPLVFTTDYVSRDSNPAYAITRSYKAGTVYGGSGGGGGNGKGFQQSKGSGSSGSSVSGTKRFAGNGGGGGSGGGWGNDGNTGGRGGSGRAFSEYQATGLDKSYPANRASRVSTSGGSGGSKGKGGNLYVGPFQQVASVQRVDIQDLPALDPNRFQGALVNRKDT